MQFHFTKENESKLTTTKNHLCKLLLYQTLANARKISFSPYTNISPWDRHILLQRDLDSNEI